MSDEVDSKVEGNVQMVGEDLFLAHFQQTWLVCFFHMQISGGCSFSCPLSALALCALGLWLGSVLVLVEAFTQPLPLESCIS